MTREGQLITPSPSGIGLITCAPKSQNSLSSPPCASARSSRIPFPSTTTSFTLRPCKLPDWASVNSPPSFPTVFLFFFFPFSLLSSRAIRAARTNRPPDCVIQTSVGVRMAALPQGFHTYLPRQAALYGESSLLYCMWGNYSTWQGGATIESSVCNNKWRSKAVSADKIQPLHCLSPYSSRTRTHRR